MAEDLALSVSSFAQDAFGLPAARADTPGAQRIEGYRVIAIRHLASADRVRDAFADAALPWPETMSELQASGDSLLARRHPEEVLLLTRDAQAAQGVLQRLASGSDASAIAIDLSHGMAVYELAGPRLDDWLAHLVDASAIPRVGASSRCRLIDIAVYLLRPSIERVLLIADRAYCPYLAQWLAFSHEGAA